ncbi:MAG: hypothetical protein ACP5K1_04955, partial [Candidatus Bathyarchaeia archaeon]
LMEVEIVKAELILFEVALSAPLIAAIISIIIRRWGNYTITGSLSASASGLGLLSSIILARNIISKGSLIIEAPWMKSYGIEIAHSFYIDELAVFFIVITSFFGFISILYSIGDMANEKAYPRYYALMLLFQASMIGLFSSGNLLLLVIILGASRFMLLPAYRIS